MEEAREEFCLCLPSTSSAHFRGFLETCLASNGQDDGAEVRAVHQLLAPLGWQRPSGLRKDLGEVVRVERSMTNKAPNVKLEVFGAVMHNTLSGDEDTKSRSQVQRKLGKNCRAIPEIESDEEEYEQVDEDLPYDEDYSDQETRNTQPKVQKIETDDQEKVKKKRGRPKGKKGPYNVNQDLLCTYCGQEFIKGSRRDIQKVYQRHILKHQVETFVCDCEGVPRIIPRPGQERVGNDFKLKERHMKVEHLGWQGCHQCIQCFESEEQLTEHVEKHSLTFICDLCGFVASNPQSLKDHTKKKHESTPLPCPDCGKIMGSKIALDSHKRKVHSASACVICGVVVKNIKVHMQEMHMDDSEKRYHCEDCGKGFMDKQRLTDHRINMHIKSQPHKCRYGCENRYNDKSNRNAHERRRHGEVYNANHARNSTANFTIVN